MEAEKAGSAEVRSELKRVRAKLEDVGSSSRSELQALKVTYFFSPFFIAFLYFFYVNYAQDDPDFYKISSKLKGI